MCFEKIPSEKSVEPRRVGLFDSFSAKNAALQHVETHAIPC
jgi:hypothetical protein